MIPVLGRAKRLAHLVRPQARVAHEVGTMRSPIRSSRTFVSAFTMLPT
jgi:hypothetical protein